MAPVQPSPRSQVSLPFWWLLLPQPCARAPFPVMHLTLSGQPRTWTCCLSSYCEESCRLCWFQIRHLAPSRWKRSYQGKGKGRARMRARVTVTVGSGSALGSRATLATGREKGALSTPCCRPGRLTLGLTPKARDEAQGAPCCRPRPTRRCHRRRRTSQGRSALALGHCTAPPPGQG